jgi:shikimate kinase
MSEILFLIGYRATGKSTVARLLAERLRWSWIDADVLLEERAGRSIRAIFADEGEQGFRERESVLLGELCTTPRRVVATGGGIVLRTENRQRMRSAGKVTWLTADAQTIWQRLQNDVTTSQRRPTLTVGGFEEVQTLLQARQPLYDACADLIVDTTGRSPDEVVSIILGSIVEGGPVGTALH